MSRIAYLRKRRVNKESRLYYLNDHHEWVQVRAGDKVQPFRGSGPYWFTHWKQISTGDYTHRYRWLDEPEEAVVRKVVTPEDFVKPVEDAPVPAVKKKRKYTKRKKPEPVPEPTNLSMEEDMDAEYQASSLFEKGMFYSRYGEILMNRQSTLYDLVELANACDLVVRIALEPKPRS